MTLHSIRIPLTPYTEPQRRWVERSTAVIDRYLDATFEGRPDARAFDGTFLLMAADVIWDADPETPDWDRLHVMTMLLQLATAPSWDDVWLLHACTSIADFYRWLEQEGAIAPERAAGIQAELDHRIVDAMRSLGLIAGASS